MQQFNQFRDNLQQLAMPSFLKTRDAICRIPLGMAWFEALPTALWRDTDSMAIAVYPNQSLLLNHAFRLNTMGHSGDQVAVIHTNLPPHQEREVWRRVEGRKVTLLMITAKKLQSVNTLSQLVRHMPLGPFIIEQGQICVPHLWEPLYAHPYQKLGQFFQQQWPNRPPLYVMTHHLPKSYTDQIQSHFGLRDPQGLEIPLPIERLNLQVERCITQHQKFQALLRTMHTDLPEAASTVTLILCNTVKPMADLKRRLAPRPVMVLNRRLDYAEQELQLIHMLHEPWPIILVESDLLPLIPLPLLMKTKVQIIHWQLPWSCEALAHQLLPGCHPQTKLLEARVLYTKEDYLTQKRWLSRQLSESDISKFIYLDHFNRVRHFCLQSGTCLRVYLENALQGWEATRQNCNSCTACIDPGDSSLWRNLLQLFLF